MNANESGELASLSVPQEMPLAVINADAPALVEGNAAPEDKNVLDGSAYIHEVESIQRSEGGGEQDQAGKEEIPYVTESYQEFGPVERNRKLYESLLQKLLTTFLGVQAAELGPVVSSYTRRTPVGFSDYIVGRVKGGDIPSFDEVMQQFPDLALNEEEEAIDSHPEDKFAIEDAEIVSETSVEVPEVPALPYS